VYVGRTISLATFSAWRTPTIPPPMRKRLRGAQPLSVIPTGLHDAAPCARPHLARTAREDEPRCATESMTNTTTSTFRARLLLQPRGFRKLLRRRKHPEKRRSFTCRARAIKNAGLLSGPIAPDRCEI